MSSDREEEGTDDENEEDDEKKKKTSVDERRGEQLKKMLKDLQTQTKDGTSSHRKNASRNKSRAQMTAASALSLVHVSLLSTALYESPDTKFHTLEVVLIAVTMTIMFIAGILTILISHAQEYVNKHGLSLCSELRENCCVCSCADLTNNQDDDEKIELTAPRDEKAGDNTTKYGSDGRVSQAMPLPPWTENLAQKTTIPMVNSDETIPHCCGRICTADVYPNEDYLLLQKYYHLQLTFAENEMMLIRSEMEINYAKEVWQEHLDRVNALYKILNTTKDLVDSDRTRLKTEIKKCYDFMDKARDQKKEWEDIHQKAAIYLKQGENMTSYAEAIQTDKANRLIEHWQNVLNYIMYVIGALNALIAGLTYNK